MDTKTQYWNAVNQITEQYLKDNPTHIFVFGDNLKRYGTGGAAKFRNFPNTYGFITKKAPTHNDKDYYRPIEYIKVYKEELAKLIELIEMSPDNTWLISPVGSGLANKYKIWEEVIEPTIKNVLAGRPNVKFLW